MASLAAPIEPGQFDDAPETQGSEETTIRDGGAYIDIYNPDEEDELDDEDEDEDEDEDDEIYDAYDENRVEDEDWEIAERAEKDFTKQFNRLRQHVAVRTGNAQGVASTTTTGASVASLPVINQPRPIPSQTATKSTSVKDKTVDQLAAFTSKYNSRLVKIDAPYILGVGVNRKGPSAHANIKDKSDRATNEQVLDPRTRLILFKMIGRGLIDEVNGCVSTGKEANVYHALTPEAKHLALKIYKTSILVFKDRDKYVTGEYRFRRGYSRRNPRKMVRVWAEKEMRNLKRLVTAGIRCPDPIEVRENVLVMTFLGDEEGWASPRLKDASLPADTLNTLYMELVLIVRHLFHRCKLVHADLSEYNILYHQNHLYIIDVSQSVEHDHPSAFDFLRNDIKNVEDFFGRLGVHCLGLRRCFEFVTREKLIPESHELPQTTEEIDKLEEQAFFQLLEQQEESQSNESPNSVEAAHEDSVFMRSFIPRTLNEVYDPERDVEKLTKGNELIYADTIGIVKPTLLQSGENEVFGGQLTEGTVKQKNMAGSTAPTGSTPSTKVRFATSPQPEEAKGDQEDINMSTAEVNSVARRENSDEDEDETGSDGTETEEEGSGNENEEQQKGEWIDKKPKGHRHEDREAKKFSSLLFAGFFFMVLAPEPLLLLLHPVKRPRSSVRAAIVEITTR
ncbi:RIO1-domain-containing protein [Macrolepiota fuliginosa MF-IS2]|uniref:Serine/threonine-protein kinase RIO1 n=1 Tax=Macrolepiota fuliginosa MF-IS2 TaxID=1400762 RepID=A0A9P5XH24_9AGAR|nr:RIO1-domain-containing protein [Macrolepiota fuliginosa MF-IS2]